MISAGDFKYPYRHEIYTPNGYFNGRSNQTVFVHVPHVLGLSRWDVVSGIFLGVDPSDGMAKVRINDKIGAVDPYNMWVSKEDANNALVSMLNAEASRMISRSHEIRKPVSEYE